MTKTFGKLCEQGIGKMRRFWLVWFRKAYVAQQVERRQGECNQCGNCCELLFKCPFLIKSESGDTLCSIYENRPNNARHFPLTSGVCQKSISIARTRSCKSNPIARPHSGTPRLFPTF